MSAVVQYSKWNMAVPVPSCEAEIRLALSGLKDTANTGPLWPVSSLVSVALRSSIIRSSTSSETHHHSLQDLKRFLSMTHPLTPIIVYTHWLDYVTRKDMNGDPHGALSPQSDHNNANQQCSSTILFNIKKWHCGHPIFRQTCQNARGYFCTSNHFRFCYSAKKVCFGEPKRLSLLPEILQGKTLRGWGKR